MDLEVAKQSAREWSADYGRVSVEDKPKHSLRYFLIMTEQQSLEWDANTVMEQIHMAEIRTYADGCIMFLFTSIS